MFASTSTRELHHRVNDGIRVRLLWSEEDGRLWVRVVDHKRGAAFVVEVHDRTRALDVFHHPYSYAAHYGIATDGSETDIPQTQIAA
jgi:hypothetical protein